MKTKKISVEDRLKLLEQRIAILEISKTQYIPYPVYLNYPTQPTTQPTTQPPPSHYPMTC